MKVRIPSVVVGLLALMVSLSLLTFAQAPVQASSALPHLIRFSGTVRDLNGIPLSGLIGVTFALYSEPSGGGALWLETQNVNADSNGHYTVLLGLTHADGLPAELFISEQARWVGVQVSGQAEQPRVLLASAPYALKAGDAETIGGLPPSAFMLAGAGSTARPNSDPIAGAGVNASGAAAITGAGTTDFIPLWTAGSILGNSALFQTGSGNTAMVGVDTITPAATLDVNGNMITRGALQLPSTGTANSFTGFNSQPFSLQGSAFNSGTGKAIGPIFQWQAEPSGNNTSNPTGTLNLLYGNGSGSPVETGLNVAGNGRITFATGQTFPGAGTITGVTTAAGSGLMGGGTSGTLNLALTNACSANQILQWNGNAWTCTTIGGGGTITGVTAGTDLTGGGTTGTVTLNLDTTKVPQLNVANTFNASQTVNGNLSATGVVSGGSYQIGSNLFAFGNYFNGNAFLGFAGNATMTGTGNTGLGFAALFLNTTGSGNTAIGSGALKYTITDSLNTAVGQAALLGLVSGSGNTEVGGRTEDIAFYGSNNTFVGASAGAAGNITLTSSTAIGASAVTGGSNTTMTNATAIGANAQVTADNALVLGSINGVNNATASVNVGIGTTAPQATLDVAGSQLETFIGNPGCGSHPFAGLGFGSTGLSSCQNYSMVGDGVNTYVAAPTGTIYFRTNSNALTAMTIDVNGNVNIAGNLSKGGGSLKIDHPLDPANKYLYHSFVESPDMMNIYNGVAILDAHGSAWITLPDYFEALNRDFRYQLTAIGVPGPNLYIVKKVSGNRFKIGGGKPKAEVSWQVTGIRHDAYANAHRIPNDEEKPADERGKYLHPELFGASQEQAIGHQPSPSSGAVGQIAVVGK